MATLGELETAYREAQQDPGFLNRLEGLLREYVGRPTPLYLSCRLTAHCGGARIYLKREDLAHTGAHKINNTLGQALLAQRMGKQRACKTARCVADRARIVLWTAAGVAVDEIAHRLEVHRSTPMVPGTACHRSVRGGESARPTSIRSPAQVHAVGDHPDQGHCL